MRLLYDRLLVELIDDYEGPLVLLFGAKERTTRGIVRAAGPGKRDGNGILTPTMIEVGDHIAFSKNDGQPFSDDRCDEFGEGKKHILIRASDVLAVIEDRGEETQ